MDAESDCSNKYHDYIPKITIWRRKTGHTPIQNMLNENKSSRNKSNYGLKYMNNENLKPLKKEIKRHKKI